MAGSIANVDAAALESALAATVVTGEVRFDAGSKALYATDGSNYRQVPIGVVIPKSKQDVIETIAVMSKIRRSPAFARWRHESGGAVLQRGCCHRLVEVSAQYRRAESATEICSRSTWDNLRHASQCRQALHIDMGSGPRHARPLHVRRHAG